MMEALSPLARAVQRIVGVVCALVVAVAALGVLDGERSRYGLYTFSAGGASTTTWVFGMMIAAVLTLRAPTRRSGWKFALFTVFTVMPAMVWWSVEHYAPALYLDALWPEEAMLALVGAIFILACVALPIAMLVCSERIDHEPPTARVVR